ncbi:hypothetical protein KY308_01200, partial [Candidatus Woesearchaeota archaeon]|nr:hypothetical protein [Candidatus Woesearchaeota archaeon]
YPGMPRDKVNKTVADIASKTEESLVHGIGLEWYVQANRKFKLGERFGFTEQELLKSSRRRVEEKEKEAVRKMTIDSSPQKVLSLYIDNHEEFLKVRERYMQKI